MVSFKQNLIVCRVFDGHLLKLLTYAKAYRRVVPVIMGCCCLSLLECCATVLAYLVTEDWNETDRRHGFGGCWPTGTAFKFMALGWEAALVAASRLISIRQGKLEGWHGEKREEVWHDSM